MTYEHAQKAGDRSMEGYFETDAVPRQRLNGWPAGGELEEAEVADGDAQLLA